MAKNKTETVLMVPVKLGPGAVMPQYAHADDAGADLVAAIKEPVVIYPGQRKAIGTGLCMAIPPGYELQIRPRSGLAMNHALTVLNSPGTIDAGFRGEIRVILINHDQYTPFTVQPGMRIAQAVVAPVLRAFFHAVETLDETARGAGGFGSSGV